jgi:hypothetical protein
MNVRCQFPDHHIHGGNGAGGWLTEILLIAAWFLLKTAAKAAGFLLIVAAVAAFRWFSGAPMWGRTAFPTAWPRWERAVARCAVTLPIVTALWWPWPTLAALLSLVAAFGSAVVIVRRKRRRAAETGRATARRLDHPAPIYIPRLRAARVLNAIPTGSAGRWTVALPTREGA